MLCCGNKNDVNRNNLPADTNRSNVRHNQVRAAKVFGADDTVQSSAITTGFVPIR